MLFGINLLPQEDRFYDLISLLQGEVVRFAAVQEPGIRCEAERGLDEPVVILVHAAGERDSITVSTGSTSSILAGAAATADATAPRRARA